MKIARPRDAASLVLWRKGPDGPEILMGRRSARHRFLPDMFVFPGGRLDPADYEVDKGAFRRDVAERIGRHTDERRAKALGVAALRETDEETGLKLDSLDVLDYVARAITPSRSPIRFHGRFFLGDATMAVGTIGGSGELLDLAFRPVDACLGLPIADITEFILGRVDGIIGTPNADREALFWHYRGTKRIVSRD